MQGNIFHSTRQNKFQETGKTLVTFNKCVQTIDVKGILETNSMSSAMCSIKNDARSHIHQMQEGCLNAIF